MTTILVAALCCALQNPQQGPVSAFPNSPKAPPPRVKDITVPPAPVTPGPLTPQLVSATTPLTAEEAARIALHLQPSLGVQVGAIQQQQGKTKQTGAPGNPQLVVGAGFDKVQSISGPGAVFEAPNDVTTLGVSPIFLYSGGTAIRQLLYDFNQTRNLVRQSEALEKAAAEDLTTAQQDLVINVKSAFYNYANQVRLIHVNEGNVANRQRQLDLANARLAAGIGQPSDVATAQTSKSQGILNLNEARDAAEQARIQLLQQMGVDPLTPITVTDEAASTPNETDAKGLTQAAIKQRPEVHSALQALAAAKYGLSAAKAVDLPQLYAEAGVGVGGTDFPLKDNTANIGIGFQFPLFDGGNREGAMRTARGQITTADANLKTAILQVKTDVASAYMALKSAEQRVSIADNEVYNAQEDVRVAEGRYAAGVGLFLDVTTAQALLLTAQTDRTNARNSLDQARIQLRRATGELLADLH